MRVGLRDSLSRQKSSFIVSFKVYKGKGRKGKRCVNQVSALRLIIEQSLILLTEELYQRSYSCMLYKTNILK